MATNYTDWDTFDVIDDTKTDKTFVPNRLLSQDDDSDFSDSEIIEDDEYPVFDFCKTGKIPEKFSSTIFNEAQGPVDPLYYKNSVLDIWESIFSPIVDIIVVESNVYAIQKHAVLDTSAEEIRAFIGILIFMGYHYVPSIRLYWSTNQNVFCHRVPSQYHVIKKIFKIITLCPFKR